MLIQPSEWQAIAAGLQALATIALVLVTIWYASKVGEQTDEARKSAEASQRSLDHLTAEKRKWAVDALHELRNEMRSMKQKTQRQLSQDNFGNISPSDLYNGERLQRLRGLAVGVGGESGQEAMIALHLADKANKRRHDYADSDYSEDSAHAYREALKRVRVSFEDTEIKVNNRLQEFRDGGPYQPVPELTSHHKDS